MYNGRELAPFCPQCGSWAENHQRKDCEIQILEIAEQRPNEPPITAVQNRCGHCGYVWWSKAPEINPISETSSQ
jgi:hypothetical protein